MHLGLREEILHGVGMEGVTLLKGRTILDPLDFLDKAITEAVLVNVTQQTFSNDGRARILLQEIVGPLDYLEV